MQIHKMEQRSDEWFAIRKGKMTASEAQAIATNGVGLQTYIFEILAEKYSNNRVSFSNKDTERGVELEDSARMTYEIERSDVETVGFIEMDEFTGCSPDGLVGEEGGFEAKCPNDVNFFKLLVNGEKEIPAKYVWQCQMSLLITGRKWWDLAFYNPNFEQNLLIFRITPDLAKQEKLIVGIAKGKALIQEFTQKYEQR